MTSLIKANLHATGGEGGWGDVNGEKKKIYILLHIILLTIKTSIKTFNYHSLIYVLLYFVY